MQAHTRIMYPLGDGTDMLHDHLSLGFHRGCVACAQLEADMARCRKSLDRSDAVVRYDLPKGAG